MNNYEVVIGLEVHCQLKTKSKMFCACPFVPSGRNEQANTQIDAYTLGLPGTLPVPNEQAICHAIALALATESTVNLRSRWARKHYFYPDLPKGYQITQSDHPYASGGRVVLPGENKGGKKRNGENAEERSIPLTRIHMEEDAGKNTHVAGEDVSLLDYNRAGAPLVEIVSEPAIRSAAEAAVYLKELRALVRYLGISDANMEEGTLRCDANVSLREKGSDKLGTRCEIKNLNSFKFLESAIEAEVRRQADLLSSGESIVQATMGYDADRDRTFIMRTKEDAADYRYFPEPDMPPLLLSESMVADIRKELPELPAARRQRYRELGLNGYDAGVLTGEPALGNYFDQMLGPNVPAKKACNWLTVELLGRLNQEQRKIEDSPVTPRQLAEIVRLVESGEISGRNGKDVFNAVYRGDGSPQEVVEREGFQQVSDTSAIEKIVDEILANNPEQVEQFRAGKEKVRGFFVGQVMKQSRGQANPKLVNEILNAKLKS